MTLEDQCFVFYWFHCVFDHDPAFGSVLVIPLKEAFNIYPISFFIYPIYLNLLKDLLGSKIYLGTVGATYKSIFQESSWEIRTFYDYFFNFKLLDPDA
jgi:hypothetical protein